MIDKVWISLISVAVGAVLGAALTFVVGELREKLARGRRRKAHWPGI